MSENAEEKVMDGVPDDYPGKVVVFPQNVEHIVYAQFGVQAKSAGDCKPIADKIYAFLSQSVPPEKGHVERARYTDRWDHHHEIVMGYFLDRGTYDALINTAEFKAFWANLPCDENSDLGVFKEVAYVRKDYFEYATGGDDKVAAAALLDLEGSNKFGYWGAYRDRVPASEHDKFLPAIQEMPTERDDPTRGQRLTVKTPDNMCFIREGQGHANNHPDEQKAWESSMESKIDRWIKYLGDDPAKTGCISIRDCEEYDPDTGRHNKRFCQNAFLISLSHIERAAKTVCEHVELRQGLIDMFTEATFVPQMHLYVEVQILQSDEMDIEYINCHPKTGFLRFFEGQPLAIAAE